MKVNTLHKINNFIVKYSKCFRVYRIFASDFVSLVAQLCPIFCDPMDCIPPGSSVHRILQARMLEWAATPFSRGSS